MQAIAAPIIGLFQGSATLSSVVGLAGAALSGISAINQASYQSALATRTAKLEEENARRILDAGQKDAQMQDLQAAEAIADEIALNAASGFSVNSPTFVRRRTRLHELATQDRSRIVEDARVQGQAAMERAAGARAEAKAAKRSGFFAFLEAGLTGYNSLLGDANLASSLANRKITQQASTV